MRTQDLRNGDCLEVMQELEENSIDTIITDPPYGLSFMGKNWDRGVPGAQFWEQALRVAKPGAGLLAFGGTRTYHRLAVAIEDAGWELRDCLMWLYGSGFPKSLDISQAIDRSKGAEREVVGERSGFKAGDGGTSYALEGGWKSSTIPITAPATDLAQKFDGYGTALKPAWEPIILAQAPLDGTYAQNAEKWGCGGLWIDGCRVGTDGGGTNCSNRDKVGKCKGHPDRRGTAYGITYHADNSEGGRFPANLILDEHAGAMLDRQSGDCATGKLEPHHNLRASENIAMRGPNQERNPRQSFGGDTGGASRFFYCAKASRAEREQGLDGGRSTQVRNFHPTVKPLELMRWLVRLTRTPSGGTVLDPFMGSGTTGVACKGEDRDFVGIELSPEYYAIAQQRIENTEIQANLF